MLQIPGIYAEHEIHFMDMVRNADMVVFNRSKKEYPLAKFRRSIKVVNPSAEVIFEDEEGEMTDILADSNAYYLLDANGYLIKGKMVKAANKYYYLSNKNGVVYREKLVKYGKYRYYFTSDGRRATWKKRWALCKGAGNRDLQL